MVLLKEVANKLQNILNGVDSETSDIPRNNEYYYLVNGIGYYLDEVVDKNTKKNFIPVFVNFSNNGSFQPIPDLLEQDVGVEITLYFPVRFRNDFFNLGDYLAKVFVGKTLNYGENTGICVSNIDIATFGEIQELDVLEQFKDFINVNYGLPIKTTEKWLSMSFTLYLNTTSNTNKENGTIYANSVKKPIIYLSDGENAYELENPIFISQTLSFDGTANAQQILGESYAKGLIATSVYSRVLPLYVQNNDFFKTIFNGLYNRTLNSLTLTIRDYNPIDNETYYDHKYYISSLTFTPSLGNLLGITITLNDLLEV